MPCRVTSSKRLVLVLPYIVNHLWRFMHYRGDDEFIPNGMADDNFKNINLINTSQSPFTITSIQKWLVVS